MEPALSTYYAYLWAVKYIEETHPDGVFNLCDVIDYLYPQLSTEERLAVLEYFE